MPLHEMGVPLSLQTYDDDGDILDARLLLAKPIDLLAMPQFDEFHQPQSSVVRAIVALYLVLSNDLGYLDLLGDYRVPDWLLRYFLCNLNLPVVEFDTCLQNFPDFLRRLNARIQCEHPVDDDLEEGAVKIGGCLDDGAPMTMYDNL